MHLDLYEVPTQAYSDHPESAHVRQVCKRLSQIKLLLALLNLGTPSSQLAPSPTPPSSPCRQDMLSIWLHDEQSVDNCQRHCPILLSLIQVHADADTEMSCIPGQRSGPSWAL